MKARAIMLMGTGSDVGKSLISAGLCRALTLRGYRVKPFKPQNMSNNAAVTIDGGEIGRAQALQARAAKVDPTVHMNPILLKPETNTGAQVIVQGHRHATMTARQYFTNRAQFLPAILAKLSNTCAGCGLHHRRRRGKPWRNQPAERGLGKHGLRRSGRRSGGAGRRYPPGRRDRLDYRHL